MDELVAHSTEAVGEGGALARAIPGFRPRPAQGVLADAVARCVGSRGSLIAEAGTGTGKTYAYLVPAVLSGQRTIISTGTRALQDQLFQRDLPRVRKALGVGLRAALLKGRSNYLCLHRMEQARQQVREPRLHALLATVEAWSTHTGSGDLAELPDLPEDSTLLPMITSTVDNCLGSECPAWSECFVLRARQAAQAADLVVVNHHLLLSDLALREEGFGELLPGADTFILDEAHQLPDLAAQFFGARLSARQLADIARDTRAECDGVDGAFAALRAPIADLEGALDRARLAMDGLPARAAAVQALSRSDVVDGLEGLAAALEALSGVLSAWEQASPGLAACRTRAQAYAGRIADWVERGEASPPVDEETLTDDAPALSDVRWFEAGPRGFVLQRTPLDVSAQLRRFRERSGAAWVFTSATLSVAGSFAHVAARLGLDEPETVLLPSPFDWDHQAVCYLPVGLPEPNDRDYGACVVERLRPVLEASRGRAFLLFTSHRALNDAAERLADGPWPLFVQGRAPRNVLLEQFRASGNGVLLGAASFWEGVDVAGDALSVVAIDRIPFASPGDPVLEARLDAVRQRGGNPFRDEQVPSAVIALKQGVGRLIRTLEDRGVLVLCDPRLTGKGYGRLFMASLPPIPRTHDIGRVRAFFDPVSFNPDGVEEYAP